MESNVRQAVFCIGSAVVGLGYVGGAGVSHSCVVVALIVPLANIELSLVNLLHSRSRLLLY